MKQNYFRKLLSFSQILVLSLICWFGLTQPPHQVTAAENCDLISCNKDTQTEEEYLSCNKRKQTCWEERIHEAQSSANTLGNTISLINGKIQVQQLQIDQTVAEIKTLEREIDDLTKRISGLNLSLDRLTTVLVKRVQEQYKRSHIPSMAAYLTKKNFTEAWVQQRYLSQAQAQTAEVMQKAEAQKQTYDAEKNLKETKQIEVEKKEAQLLTQKTELDKQKKEQQFLLDQTKNDEARYKRELEKTLAELEAIQSIIAGNGNETEVKEVQQGDQIASIIVGASACSTGSHLHFEVVKDNAHRDPAGFLKPIDAAWSNQPDSSFGFGGSWDWPLNNAARINQGYGMTYYARVRRAYGGAPHTGIDIISKSSGDYAVKAVKAGTLYRGSIPCGGGLLRYVRVAHKEDGYHTYYLHVNY